MKRMKKHTASELQQLYLEADEADKKVFAEMRSNILLISGDHYTRKNSRFISRIRDSKHLSDEQKIRLTKNHIQKIHKVYCDTVITAAPGVSVGPSNTKELQDQKAAELHQAVWSYGKQEHSLDEKISDWIEDFFGLGEVATKLYFDPTAGKFKGYEQEVDMEGNPLFIDAQGQVTTAQVNEVGQPHEMKPSKNAQFTGDVVFERLYAFNLLRASFAKSMDESPFLIIRKMTDIAELTAKLDPQDENYEKKKKAITETSNETFLVFDPQQGDYKSGQNQCMVKEFYFRPCVNYPNGYFYILVGDKEGQVFWEGELPFGIFPIITEVCEKAPTHPRGISPIRTMRPYQIEINRAASKLAEHQVTLGDDKLIYMEGAKMTQGALLPGVRGIAVSGAPPTILPGRDGSQYLKYMESQIAELYSVMMMTEMMQDNSGQLEPFVLLYRAASQKKRFSRYIRRIERFQRRVCETYLELQRRYLPDDALIPMVGRREMVNIAEFRNAEKLCYQIKVEAQSEDVETKLGKQLVLNHALQYVGQKLEKEDIGKIMRAMPYANFEESFGDFVLDSDSAQNMILALDRGEIPVIDMNDSKPYMVKRLTARMRQADFRFLAPNIQANYERTKQQYQALIVKERQELQAAEADLIPTGGALIGVDYWITDKATGKTRRAKFPYEAIHWLEKRLEQQGSSLEQLNGLQSGTLAEMAQMALSQSGHGPSANGMAGRPHMGSATGPQGVASNGNGNPNPVPGNFDARVLGAGTSPGGAVPGKVDRVSLGSVGQG
jgi:hypothetical protein